MSPRVKPRLPSAGRWGWGSDTPRTRGGCGGSRHQNRLGPGRGFPSGLQVSHLDDERWEPMILKDKREDAWSFQIKTPVRSQDGEALDCCVQPLVLKKKSGGWSSCCGSVVNKSN